MSREKLVLVDGSSYLYRAFHALPPLTNAAGVPTGAVYGVTNMLLKLLSEHEPAFVAVLFDARGKTFRDEIYAQYKATRPPMPDDLAVQIEPLHAVVRALGLPLVQIEGVEADDVIGTLTTAASRAGMDTLVSTIDKDMAQLVDRSVTLVNTMFDTVLDAAGVRAKFGVEPTQIVDYLALVGDTSDNIPGVPGVGAKTAAALLGAFDSLDEIYAGLARVAEVKVRGAAKLGAKLEENREQAMISRQLATLLRDVKLELGPRDLRRQPPDNEALRKLYTELGFGTLLRQLPPATSAAATADTQTDYTTIVDERELARWLDELARAPRIGLHIETTGSDYRLAEITGVAFALAAGKAAYLPVAHRDAGAAGQLTRERALAALQPLLESASPAKIGHDLKRQAHALVNHGIAPGGLRFDVMLESYVLNSTAVRHDLASIAQRYLGRETVRLEDVAGKGAKKLGFDEVDIEQAAGYAAQCADVAVRLDAELSRQLDETGRLATLYEEIEQPLIGVLQRMEYGGVLIDTGMLERHGKELTAKMAALEKEAYAEAGTKFNPGSPKQLQEVLFDVLGLPVRRKTPKGQPSTAEDVLQELAEEFRLPAVILEHRQLSKLKSTYIDNLPRQVNAQTGRVHTSYQQAVAATGRLSSTDPNLQNIPIRTPEGRRIRQAFVAPEGHLLLAADYSQIELRIMAHLSGDEGLRCAFAEGRDVHQATAAEVFGLEPAEVSTDQRRSAKAINFGLIYGMSAFGLAKQLAISRRDAQQYVNLYFERYPGVKAFMDTTREQARERGYVETVFGRRLYLPEITSRNAQRRQYAERSAINAPMQGTAADIIKRAMIAVDDWLRDGATGARLIMQVHDELVLEVPEAEIAQVDKRLAELMTGAASLSVPLHVDVGRGRNWDEAH